MTAALRIPDAVAGARILAFGDYQPARIVTNDELSKTVDTNDEWIRSRVGIAERRIAGDDEGIVELGVHAGGKALAGSGLAPSDIDLVILATCSAESPMPGHAPAVAHRLGIKAPGAFDINAACAGFCYALGAGAAVVTGSDTPGIGPVVWGSAGDGFDKIIIDDRHSFIRQEGQAVFRWATTAIAPIAREACERAGIAPEDLAAIVPHQANLRIIEAIARRVKATNAVVADDIIHSGNTSGASIPLALSHMIERGDVPSGAPALLVGFGAGLSYAAQVIQIP